jgi:hypothetical protein
MLSETYFSTHAVESLREHATIADVSDRRFSAFLSGIANDIASSVKFRVPDYGDILGWADTKAGANIQELMLTYAKPFRLPYPMCAIEFHHPNTREPSVGYQVEDFDATISLAKEITIKGEAAIEIIPVPRIIVGPEKIWLPANFAIAILESGGITFRALTPHGRQLVTGLSLEQGLAIAGNDCHRELISVIQLIAALACRNVRQRVQSPSERLNKKRRDKKKIPFYSYHTLEIVDASNPATNGGGSHNSPRVHLRRGHIRQLPKGPVWVNACVVGNKKLGMVGKDYRIPSTAVPPAPTSA